jgi:hypothetical protein
MQEMLDEDSFNSTVPHLTEGHFMKKIPPIWKKCKLKRMCHAYKTREKVGHCDDVLYLVCSEDC